LTFPGKVYGPWNIWNPPHQDHFIQKACRKKEL